MIIFDLKCEPLGHVFEAWFGSTEEYEAQHIRGLVSCPLCSSAEVTKAPMAPRVGAKSNQLSKVAVKTREADTIQAVIAMLATAQREQLRHSDFVGDRFPDEARAIHLGEAEARAIHGSASPSEAENLLDEGINVAPLLFPVIEPGVEN